MVERHPMPNGMRIVCKSDPFEVRSAIEVLMGTLNGAGLPPEDHGSVELVLAEVMNNIVEHAYLEDPAGQIEVNLVRTDAGLTCKVMDYGKPMPGNALPAGKAADLDVELMDLPEGGFGWFLIGKLAQDLRYSRQGNANHLDFCMAFDDAAAT